MQFLDQLLGWCVIAFPFLLSIVFIFIPTKADNERKHMKWRIALIVTGIIFSFLAWWQQSRSLQAATRDRDDAIDRTSDKVAAQTTINVTNALAAQYGSTIRDMIGKLDQQGQQVDVIRHSDIVTGKKPLAVVITNPAAPDDGGQVPEIHVAPLSAMPNLEYGKKAYKFILTTNQIMNGGRVAVSCTKGKINQGSAEILGASALHLVGGGVQDEHTYVSGIGSPNWSPDFPLAITLYSDDDLGVCHFRPLK